MLRQTFALATFFCIIFWVCGLLIQFLSRWIDWNGVLTYAPVGIVALMFCTFILSFGAKCESSK